MAMDLNVYTGIIKYKEIDFTFSFDGEELRLIPPIEKKEEVNRWFMTELGGGAFTIGDPVYVEDDILEATCNESGAGFVFLVDKNHTISKLNSVLVIPVYAYIKRKFGNAAFDRIRFSADALNYIYPTQNALEKKTWTEEGTIEVATKKIKETLTEKQEFLVDGKLVKTQFDIVVMTDSKAKMTPILLQSTLTFDFEETTDYLFISRLWLIAKEFIQYLCYRKNIVFKAVELSSPFKDGGHLTCAEFFIIEDEEVIEETRPLEKGWYIEQKYVKDCIGEILSDIADKKLYMRHLPESYKSGRIINEARFVMITAAFEWEVRRLYPSGFKKSEKTVRIENEAKEAMDDLISKSSGDLSKKFKYLKKQIDTMPLKNKIMKVGEDFDSAIGLFGRRLYELNGEELNYAEMGERLSKQRNNYAHGNLDKDFIGASLCDLVYLEYMLYAMQLRIYGVDDDRIKRAINKLFHLNFAL